MKEYNARKKIVDALVKGLNKDKAQVVNVKINGKKYTMFTNFELALLDAEDDYGYTPDSKGIDFDKIAKLMSDTTKDPLPYLIPFKTKRNEVLRIRTIASNKRLVCVNSTYLKKAIDFVGHHEMYYDNNDSEFLRTKDEIEEECTYKGCLRIGEGDRIAFIFPIVLGYDEDD